MTSSASPESRLPRLAPPSTSSPMPVARRRSISAQSGGAEHVSSVPVSFSTQRNAEMSSFDPSRIPAWLAPVCDDRSVSHSVSRYSSSASQRAIVGALPSRIARFRTGSASPSISRKMIPGTSVLAIRPCRRAIRCAMRIEEPSCEPSTTARTTLTAATTSEARSAQPKLSTSSAPSVTSRLAATSRISASATSTSRKPTTSVSGRRRAARIGGMTALSADTTAATSRAPQKLLMSTPGRTPAATIRATPVANQETRSGNSRILACSGCHDIAWPYVPLGICISFRIRWRVLVVPVEPAPAGLLALGPLLRLLLCARGLLLGHLDPCVRVRRRDEKLAARPTEDGDDEDERDHQVPGSGDQLLRGRVVDGDTLRHVAARVESERVRCLGDPDRARRERHDVRERDRPGHPHDRLERH